MYQLEIGPLFVTFHRTVRVANHCISDLPPSLGVAELYKVQDYKSICPKEWNENSYFLTVQDKEAIWISFQTISPLAVIVGLGGINALNSNHFDPTLKEGGYLVTPPQPWLDGWKGEDGCVYQFVASSNNTVGEQLGSNKKELEFAVFEPVDKSKLKKSGRICGLCSLEAIGVAKGGKITQKIYEDPHGIDVWQKEPIKIENVYLINASQFAEITKSQEPSDPVTAEEYSGIYYKIKDEELKDIEGTKNFDQLKSV